MLKNCTVQKKQISVLRLSNITQSLGKTLLELGIDSANIEATSRKLTNLGVVSTAEDVLDDAFRPRNKKPTPYAISRFGDGSIGICYAALEKKTCKQEILFHLNDALNELPNLTRFYSLIQCQYHGLTADLCGCESKYPCLVSKTKQGYPFCQQIGFKAIQRGIEGLFAPSARQKGGTCVPVITRSSLSGPRVISTFRVLRTTKKIEFQLCSDKT